MLKQNIKQDIKKAMQEKNELLLCVLRGVNAVIQNKEIEKKQELRNEDIISIISSEVKKRKDAIEQFKKGERNDLVEKEEKELEILQKYLPEQMSEENIKELAKKVIKEVNAVSLSDTGKVMKELMLQVRGKADGGLVKKIVGELLK